MLFFLLYPLRDLWFGFNVFKYLTFRASMATVTSFVLCIWLGPIMIEWLKTLKLGQYVRNQHVEKLDDFLTTKKGTPTMGGAIIIFSVCVSAILWCRLDNALVLLLLFGMLWLGMIGFMDDLTKIRNKSAKGIRSMTKIVGQTVVALIIGLYVVSDKHMGTELYLPFIKNSVANLGILYIVFAWLVIVGASNAVNLTDGLDGLAIGCMIFVSLTYALMSYIAGNAVVSGYLNVFYLPGAGELTPFCGAMVGAGLGFLWFNSHPASVFMGDTGSLSLGGTIAIISVFLKKEFLLLLVGGIFVVESLSVILQVASFKLRGKRIFLMAPIHHHFQLKGWPESKITIRFWIISAILALLALAAIKAQ
ncbi:MAG: phospho-N-acetylmuramoyl-pentapeptide-transferase [Candidatus Omnitrophica bacterium]|nr:phospho-N-acetylmuramoyl-pentapeptide-transferase [Candidatus Omnitrophota bacterium]